MAVGKVHRVRGSESGVATLDVVRKRPSRAGKSKPPAASQTPPIAFYRGVVEGMTCGVLTIAKDGTITTVNEHARAILEIDTDTVGRSCHDVLGHCAKLTNVLLDSFAMASPPSRAELEVATKDGVRRTIGFSISMIHPAPGKEAEGAALFFKDLTKVEEQAERERLRDRLAALGEMAAQMAHEIRNPLTSIGVSASILRRRMAAKGEGTDLLDKIISDSARIEKTIACCLEYTRPLEPRRRLLSPTVLILDAIEQSRIGRGSPDIGVIAEVPANLPSICCDPDLIRESLVNIVNNAFEAMAGRGELRVSAGVASETTLVIVISDNGPGIKPELLDRVFFPFFTTKTSGSGIGLAMARKVAESHGGWLDVDSKPGQGATFTMKIPIAS